MQPDRSYDTQNFNPYTSQKSEEFEKIGGLGANERSTSHSFRNKSSVVEL